MPGGIAGAIGVLRGLGLAETLAKLGIEDAGDLELPAPSGERGQSALLNESALAALVAETRARASAARGRGRLPLLVGGDCPVVLGGLAAIRDAGETPSLLLFDGHEDAWPPQRSETGEASDSEVALALGRGASLPPAIGELMPLLAPERIAYIGPRDIGAILDAGIASLRDEVAMFVDDAEAAADPDATESRLASALDADAFGSFWLHIDLDVLSSEAFAAVDYPQPGGLGWALLDRLAARGAGHPRCRGVSIVIYNPDLDPRRDDAKALIEFAGRMISG